MKNNKLIPRKIWMLWYQGVAEAPFIVRKCVDSWMRENQNWDVVVLDSDNLNNYVNLGLPENITRNISLNHLSDLVRLSLLSEYGGVWADATTFCTKPLDEWIDDYSKSGFFVFHRPGRDRIMASWFIASEKENPLIIKLYNRFRLYWMENNFNKPNMLQRKIISVLSKGLKRSERTTKYWFNPIVTKLFGVYPYFAFHYMFERLVATDGESNYVWRNTKKKSADLPHLIQHLGLFSAPSQSVIKQINNKEIPLFKLTWKYNPSRYSSDTLLYYLLEERRGLEA